ncbi:MAG: cyclic nucleotide-binding domain-containing protein [Methylococcales bacterium]|jgi:CRP-like cAMP-binding protein|nr:cyclic nucleotide-binding domain-containing protein [Methylococcales bacterium]MBT7408488.1 cyclic nucleotide-binding domain-containing protein [Methylococcales bacterium]
MEKKHISIKKLKSLIPFDSLTDDKLRVYAQNIVIQKMEKDDVIFSLGDTDYYYYYLLQGDISLTLSEDAGNINYVIHSKTEASRYQIDTHQPHRCHAKAQTDGLYIKVHRKIIKDILSPQNSQLKQDDEFWVTKLLNAKIFKNLPGQHIYQFIKRMELYPVNSGCFVVKQGEQGDYYYFITSGHFEIIRQDDADKPAIKITELSDWNGFGEEAIVANQSRNASIISTTDGVLMRLPRADFINHILKPLITYLPYGNALELIKKGSIWLDVREEFEYKQGHLARSYNLPLATIRSVIKRLNPKINYITCCDTGSRSAAAAFIIHEAGHQVSILSGGFISTGKIPKGQHEKSVDPFLNASSIPLTPITAESQLKASMIVDSARQEAQKIMSDAEIIRYQAKQEAIEIKQKASNDIKQAKKILSVAELKNKVYKQWVDQYQEENQLKSSAVSPRLIVLVSLLAILLLSIYYYDEFLSLEGLFQYLHNIFMQKS